MRIGELAKRTGLTRDTIRFYERHRLIRSQPSDNPANTYRDYPGDLVEKLSVIGQAREAGLSIADLALLFHHLEGEADDFLDINDFLAGKVAQVKNTIRQSRRFLSMLEATQQVLEDAPKAG